jgi:2-dehydropantoate 2-reductase
MHAMKYVVYGAGAIGGVVGARLFESGSDVTLIARGPHLAAIQRAGLRIESPLGADALPVPAVGHPGEIGWDAERVVLLAVKSHQTPAALAELVTVAPDDTPIVCLQNGVANEPAALRLFRRVYGVCVMCPAGHLEPGVVQAWSAPTTGLLDIGRHPRGTDALSEAIAAEFEAATFSAHSVTDVGRWKYRKLLTNLANVVEALCGPDERGGALVERLTAEADAVLAAAGIEVATRQEDRARRGTLMQLGEIAGRGRDGGSSWQSLQRGTGDIETDYLNGEIALLGRTHGMPVPANALLQRMGREAAARRQAPGTVSVASILERLDHGVAARDGSGD